MSQNDQKQIDPIARTWMSRIAQYDRKFEKWRKRCDEISKRYRDFDENEGGRRKGSDFNILWSNIQTLMPAVFARLPKPEVSRRFRDNDPVGRVAALMLERALSFEIEHYPDYGPAMKSAVLDRFLGGRGTCWVRYEPHITGTPSPQITDDADEANPQETEEIAYECAPVDYVHWRDFGHVIARTWAEVSGVWRIVYLTRKKLIERFGDAGKTVPLDSCPENIDSSGKRLQSAEMPAESFAAVYEIWDKETGEALWITKGGVILDRRPDPLELENFFPCPAPLYATTTNDSLIPVPDYKMYQDQARQLTKLATKIDGLIDMLVVRGVHDAAIKELSRMFTEAGNGTLIPVHNWNAFAEKQGLKGSIDIFDISPIVAALNEAYAAMERVENTIYQLVGVSDIQRGASDPSETYGAQKLKGQYGNMRLRNKQDEVVQFATEILKIKAQVICQHFQPKSLLRIAAADQLMPEDQQLIPQALQLLLGQRAMDPQAATEEGPLAAFRIEVTSDSMIQLDEQQEKAERMEFLAAVSGFLEKALPIITEQPQIAPLAIGMLKFGISGFKIGKTIEGMIDQMLDQMLKQAAQPQQPKPDAEMMKAQAQMQLEQFKAEMQSQLKEREIAADERLAAAQQQAQAQQNAHQNMLENQRAEQQAQIDAALEQHRIASAAALQEREQEFLRWKEELAAAVKIEVANISSKAKLQDAATDTATNEVATEVKQ